MKADARKIHPAQARDTDRTVLARLSALKQMSVKDFLELRIGYRIQELTYGGLTRETRRVLDLLADEIEGKITRKSMVADPRNPVVGTRLVREWDGAEHTVTVLRDGYDWQGRKFRSLSAVAKAITGTNWNGFRFFGMREKKRESRA